MDGATTAEDVAKSPVNNNNTSTEGTTVRAAAPLPPQVVVKVAERMSSTRIPEIRKPVTATVTSTPVGKCAPMVLKRPPHKSPVSHNPPMLMRAHSSPNPSTLSGAKENEYEVIGSEQGSSNYYMEMQSPMVSGEGKNVFGHRTDNASGAGPEEVEYKNVLSRKEGLELLKLIAPHAGQPPALPPKPANLMKFKKAVPPTVTTTNTTKIVTQIAKSQVVKSAPEPDYCSISECGQSNKANSVVNGSGRIGSAEEVDDVVETASSKSSDDTLENIIKLPNVAAIIVPKNKGSKASTGEPPSPGTNNVINKEKNVAKSVMSVKPSTTTTSPSKGVIPPGLISPMGQKEGVLKDLPPFSGGEPKRFHGSPLRSSTSSGSPSGNHLTSIVERRQNLLHRLSIQQQQSHHGMMMKRYSMDALSPQIQPEEGKGGGGGGGGPASGLFEERIPIQAEFDWYNLDAEFGKFNAQEDVIKEARSSGSESGSVSGGDEEERKQRHTAKMALERGLGELRDIERKMSTLERKRALDQQRNGGHKEMVHFC